MPTEYVDFAVNAGVATITLDRPEKRNAMNWPMLHEFYAAVKRAGTEDGVGAVVITGSGGSFCAGTDLAALNDTPEDERSTRGAASDDAPPPFQIAACPRPVIAAVDGAAMGMGAEFVTQCDVRIASTNAKFGFVFVLRGLVSDTGAGSFLLPRIIGPTEALRLLLSGEVIDAQQALELGFVTRVVAPEDLAAAAEEEARRYLKASPFAVDRMKRLVYGGMHNDLHTHMVQTAKLLAECFHSEDHAEGVAAFLERRDANFTGR